MFYPSCLHGPPSRRGPPNTGWLVAVGASFWRLLLLLLMMTMTTMWQADHCPSESRMRIHRTHVDWRSRRFLGATVSAWRWHSSTVKRYLWLDCRRHGQGRCAQMEIVMCFVIPCLSVCLSAATWKQCAPERKEREKRESFSSLTRCGLLSWRR